MATIIGDTRLIPTEVTMIHTIPTGAIHLMDMAMEAGFQCIIVWRMATDGAEDIMDMARIMATIIRTRLSLSTVRTITLM